MTQDITVAKSTMKIVRESIDTLYELTNTEDGYSGSLHKSSYGSRFGSVATILLKRGALIKTGKATEPNYKWNPNAMAPTKYFYKSVAQEMVATERERTNKYYARKKKEKATASAIEAAFQKAEEEAKAGEQPTPETSPLAGFSISELWGELKRRGCYIEDNKLAQKTVQFFE